MYVDGGRGGGGGIFIATIFSEIIGILILLSRNNVYNICMLSFVAKAGSTQMDVFTTTSFSGLLKVKLPNFLFITQVI